MMYFYWTHQLQKLYCLVKSGLFSDLKCFSFFAPVGFYELTIEADGLKLLNILLVLKNA